MLRRLFLLVDRMTTQGSNFGEIRYHGVTGQHDSYPMFLFALVYRNLSTDQFCCLQICCGYMYSV